MRHSFLTSKLFEILHANGMVDLGDKLPMRDLTLTEFFDIYNKTGRCMNLEAIGHLENVAARDVFMSLYLDLPAVIYDSAENLTYYIFRKEKDVTLALPVMSGIQNRYQIFSTDKALAEEIKDLGETVGAKETLEKIFNLEDRIKNPVIDQNNSEVPEEVSIAPKSALQALVESGQLTSITKAEPPKGVEEADSKTEETTADKIRKVVDENNSQDSHMRTLLVDAIEKSKKKKNARREQAA